MTGIDSVSNRSIACKCKRRPQASRFWGHAYGPLYLILRIPFQIFVIAWIYYFGIKLNNRKGRSLR